MISRICCGLLVVAVVTLIQSAQAEDVRAIAENKIKLAKELEKGYEKLLEPGNTTLKIGISILCAHYDLSEKRLHSRVYERYSWKDWRLQWDPSKYGGLRVIKVPAKLIWTPDDVRLYNAFHESAHRDEVNAVILHDGTVYWIPSASYTTLCGPGEKLNDRKGHCHLKLGSWTYDAEDLPLILWENGADTKFYLDDCPHVISNLEAHIKTTKYDCCPDPYASLEIDFDLEERKEYKSRDHGHQKKPKRRLGIDCEWPHCTVE